ncbi:MAG: alkaline phosphatase family protein [Candidatus Hydrogenedentes bacterium]|nr:alkaline phosphatase family protein [Candidatus Hydrogenedentota bacterium]
MKRISLVGTVCLILAGASSASGAEPRVIILGFDGVEPTIVEEMMAAGELPNLSAIRDSGSYAHLGSSNPPQSPTAWSSFATSTFPGNHGIYDFLRRTPKNYRPGVGFGSVVKPKLAPDGSLAEPPSFKSIRQGKTFWKAANEQGARCKILSVPFAFPADDLNESCMLSGLGVPDIRGTTSTFFLMSEDAAQAKNLSGGKLLPLRFNGDRATVVLEALRHPETRKFLNVSVGVVADRTEKRVTLELPDQTISLGEGEWSQWIEWKIDVTPKYTVYAISRIHVLEAGDTVRLYMTCLQFDPTRPYMRMTTPPDYGSELFERYGHFKTIGWIYDTHALRQDALTEQLFLDDVKNTMAWRETLTLDELDRGNMDLLISVWTGTDRVAHLFWRFRDPAHPQYTEEGARLFGKAVENTYKQMDAIIGKVRERLNPGDLLMIISDHGFHSFRKGFNVNTWLIRNGYLAVIGMSNPQTASNPKPFLQGYDWNRTKAYSLGLGSIFLNLQGREGQGTVSPADADALIEEIRAKLLAVTDPDTGDKIFSAIYTRDEYTGPASGDAPDLQLGYAEGYQSTKNAAKGAAPAELFEPNNDKWSGEHAASDVATTPGIFFANKTLTSDTPRIVDIGVTALEYLGKDVPLEMEGKGLL